MDANLKREEYITDFSITVVGGGHTFRGQKRELIFEVIFAQQAYYVNYSEDKVEFLTKLNYLN